MNPTQDIPTHTGIVDTTAVPTVQVHTAVIGGGPAGLMAAQVLSEAGYAVHVFDAMPSVGRKFLLAGKGGLNLTHSEGAEAFAGRYGARRKSIEALLHGFDNDALRAWAASLGVETFVGSSGRVFPKDMKAAPLLRAWLQRLRHPVHGTGVQFHMRHRWVGWSQTPLPDANAPRPGFLFETPGGLMQVQADVVVLALGGASWARLGSTGAWVPFLAQRGVAVAPLVPANCGFDVKNGWTPFFRDKFAGQPFKSVALKFTQADGSEFHRKGEFVATAGGVEGSLVYAASAHLRDEIARSGHATFYLDLLPDLPADRVLAEVSHPRGSRSLSSHLKSRLHLDGIKAAILYEVLGKDAVNDPVVLAHTIKHLPITLQSARPLDEAISTAGGVLFEVLDAGLMLEDLPGVFCAGEMLDWEAPTGGYLLQASFASGVAAGKGAAAYLAGLK